MRAFSALTVVCCAISASTSFADPQFRPANADAIIAKVKAVPNFCKDGFEERENTFEFHKLPGAEGSYLVNVMCQFYAYQGGFQFFHFSGTTATPVTIDSFEEGTLTTTDTISGFPGVTIEGRDVLVSNFVKYRGIGDCGEAADYVYNPAAKRLSLKELRAQDCEYEGEPVPFENWPVIFPR